MALLSAALRGPPPARGWSARRQSLAEDSGCGRPADRVVQLSPRPGHSPPRSTLLGLLPGRSRAPRPHQVGRELRSADPHMLVLSLSTLKFAAARWISQKCKQHHVTPLIKVPRYSADGVLIPSLTRFTRPSMREPLPPAQTHLSITPCPALVPASPAPTCAPDCRGFLEDTELRPPWAFACAVSSSGKCITHIHTGFPLVSAQVPGKP